MLPRDTLADITARHGLAVADRRAAGAHAEAIARAGLTVGDIFGEIKRAELKEVCTKLGLDSSGKEKAAILGRIAAALGESAGALTLTPPPDAEPTKERPAGKARSAAPRAGNGNVVADYRFPDATRTNNPPAGLVEFDKPPAQPSKHYAYDPHLDPQLTWAGKAEHTSFDVETVSLHIHEQVAPQAILRAVKREEAQRSLFGEPDLPESKQIDFYAHEVGWRNRLVLGDSLLVMNSLLSREQMAGKVQCIYLDPPYGVKFNSNFQPSISRRDVKDGDDASLTREPEQIQAYRDTWTLGIHSYLSYLRDRLLLARELLHESGSLFVQISDENVHHVRELLDEIFGRENSCGVIVFRKTTGKAAALLDSTCDFLLWYARDARLAASRYHEIFDPRTVDDDYNLRWLEFPDGTRKHCRNALEMKPLVAEGAKVFRPNPLTSQTPSETTVFDYTFEGQAFSPGRRGWTTNLDGIRRLEASSRLMAQGNTLSFVRYLDDFPFKPSNNIWDDTRLSGFGDEKRYVVQTSTRAVERCILMTTNPGDLVLDPTCGSGTTAYVAEQWGRRWITCDTSRVALSIARQRLLTSKFPYYRLRSDRVRDGFVYKTVPHVTLKSIAQNAKLDGCRSQEERERVIRESAEQETLYDQPEEEKARVRVSGPFTVEAIPVAVMEDPDAVPIEQMPGPVPMAADETSSYRAGVPGGDHVQMMLDLLRKTGVSFPGGETLTLPGLHQVTGPYEWLHAESGTGNEGDPRRVAVSFGPRHAPVTPVQVRDGIQETRGYDIVLFVGFACDPEAGRMIDQGVHGREVHFVAAASDILVGGLLKTTHATKLFTVFGSPDVEVTKAKDGEVQVELKGVDLYDPNTGETHHAQGGNVAAWFLDHDYDGRTFCICQAFFPGGGTKNPWEKLQRALKGRIDEERFEALRGTTSLPFKPGKRIAVKVVDDRGNEVVKVVEGRSA